eukprot:gi/632945307/ref/XP_007887978.1/ PREDICTED: uncharacterized protein LOC103176330 [Callorhinchus milii]
MSEFFKKLGHQEPNLNERDQEVFNFVKQCFDRDTKSGKNHTPVKTRIEETVDAKWRKKYERREAFLNAGFFTAIDKPYRCLGNVILDNQDLFAPHLTSEDQINLKNILESKYGEKQLQNRLIQERAEQLPILFQKDLWKQQNGFIHIKRYLNQTDWIRNAMNTGQPLSHCLQEVDHIFSASRKLASFRVLPVVQSKVNSGAARAKWKKLVYATTILGRKKKENILLLGDIPSDLEDEDTIKRIQARRREHFIEKLKIIYSVLCGLLNMRCRDLKRSTPLSSDYIQYLMKDLQTERNARPLRPLQKESARSTLRKCYPSIILSPEDMHTSDSIWKSFVHSEIRPPSSGCDLSTKVFGIIKTKSKPLAKDAKEIDGEMSDLPPWLALIEAKKTEEERFQQKLKESKNPIGTLKSKFIELQSSLDKATRKKVAMKRENRAKRLGAILTVVNTVPDVNFNSMLEILNHQSKFLEPTKHPPLWFNILKLECLVADDPTEEITNQLKKIRFFRNFTSQALPSSEERLCLLVVSLSADQLLTLAVQDALLFIMENIFKCSTKHLIQWTPPLPPSAPL